VERLNQLVAKRDLEGARRLCEEDGGMLARIVLEGLETAEQDRLAVHDAIESAGTRETTRLWQQVGYLSDIAVLSPMLGILGTVVGMIQAFNAIAFKLEAVKPIALAAGVAKALVTTAAGLVVAIPVMGFYFYFRARLHNIIASLEGIAAEIAQNISLGGRRR